MCIYTYLAVCLYIYTKLSEPKWKRMNVCTHMNVYIYKYAFMYVYTYKTIKQQFKKMP